MVHSLEMNVESDNRIKIPDIEDLISSESLTSEPYAIIRSADPGCSCSKCARSCQNIPGFFEPLGFLYYLVKLAKSDNPMIVFKIFESIVDDIQKDFYNDPGDNIYMLRPRTIKEKPGNKVKINLYAIMANCTYLETTGCKLSNETRPAECRCTYGCRIPKYKFVKPQMAEQWNSPLGRAIISLYDSIGQKKYGDEFQTGVDTQTDMLSFMMSVLGSRH